MRCALWWSVMLLVAGVLRFGYLESYPDWIHHDHSMAGAAALKLSAAMLLYRQEGIGGVWLLFTRILLSVCGAHVWVLRLTAALTSTLAVAVTYLLGREIQEQVGVVAALLLATSHVFLLYSRLPYVIDPVGPTLLVLWCGLQAWKGRGGLWAAASGALAGLTLWAYWGASLGLPLYATVLIVLAYGRPHRCWQHRWHALLWCVCFSLTAPFVWQSSQHRIGEDYIGRILAGSLAWDMPTWLDRLRRAFGALVAYHAAGGWGTWDNRPILLVPECGALVLALFALRRPAWRLPMGLCTAVVFVLTVLDSLLPAPGEAYHELLTIPFLLLLVAVGICELRWLPLIAPTTAGIMWLNLATLWPAIRPVTANSSAVAMRWMADHRDLRCIMLVRPDTGLPFAAPLYEFVRDVAVKEDTTTPATAAILAECPAAIVMPGVTVGMDQPPTQRLVSVDGAVDVYRKGTPK